MLDMFFTAIQRVLDVQERLRDVEIRGADVEHLDQLLVELRERLLELLAVSTMLRERGTPSADLLVAWIGEVCERVDFVLSLSAIGELRGRTAIRLATAFINSKLTSLTSRLRLIMDMLKTQKHETQREGEY